MFASRPRSQICVTFEFDLTTEMVENQNKSTILVSVPVISCDKLWMTKYNEKKFLKKVINK